MILRVVLAVAGPLDAARVEALHRKLGELLEAA